MNWKARNELINSLALCWLAVENTEVANKIVRIKNYAWRQFDLMVL